ncbi:MAG: flagellar assembly protein FliH [Betaproteobacteria bacterium]|nr:flagellar assembly protein FliH [Betaproteobacteria bacterium]
MTPMSDMDTPKEHLTPYQRWELPSFGSSGSRKASATAVASLPTAGELESIHQQAHDEGYQAGYAEGRQRAAQEAERLAGLIAALDRQLQQVDQEVLQGLLKLSLEVARQMVRKSLQTKPDLVLEVVREAVGSLPHFNHGARLALHPDDAALVRTAMGEQLEHSGWKIFEDMGIGRGGCRVDTAHSQIDASLDKRWQQIVASLGEDSQWMEEP